MKTYFVSDLHLFARRSHAPLHLEAIFAAAENARSFVLGGDIFDFRWTTLATIEETAEAAISWLDALVQANPHCDFHFVLGNHDHVHPFVERLDLYAQQRENLTWHKYYLRQGHSLFLHGDVADRTTSHSMLIERRDRAQHHAKRGAIPGLAYDAVVHARVHKLVGAAMNRPRKVARRIMSYIRDIGQGPETGLRHVYFGHTHSQLCHFEYEGVLFHNGGAPIKGLGFRIVETDVPLETPV